MNALSHLLTAQYWATKNRLKDPAAGKTIRIYCYSILLAAVVLTIILNVKLYLLSIEALSLEHQITSIVKNGAAEIPALIQINFEGFLFRALFPISLGGICAVLYCFLLAVFYDQDEYFFKNPAIKYLSLSPISKISAAVALMLPSIIRSLPVLLVAVCASYSLGWWADAPRLFYIIFPCLLIILTLQALSTAIIFYLILKLFVKPSILVLIYCTITSFALCLGYYQVVRPILSVLHTDALQIVSLLQQSTFSFSPWALVVSTTNALSRNSTLVWIYLFYSCLLAAGTVSLSVFIVSKLFLRIAAFEYIEHSANWSLWDLGSRLNTDLLKINSYQKNSMLLILTKITRDSDLLIKLIVLFLITIGLPYILITRGDYPKETWLALRHNMNAAYLQVATVVIFASMASFIAANAICLIYKKFEPEFLLLRLGTTSLQDFLQATIKVIVTLTLPLLGVSLLKLHVYATPSLDSCIMICVTALTVLTTQASILCALYSTLLGKSAANATFTATYTSIMAVVACGAYLFVSSTLINKIRYVKIYFNLSGLNQPIWYWYIELFCMLTLFVYFNSKISSYLVNWAASRTRRRMLYECTTN